MMHPVRMWPSFRVAVDAGPDVTSDAALTLTPSV